MPAGKTKNIYRMEKAQNERLLRENTTKHYKVAEEYAYNKINKEARVIASGLGITDRIDAMANKESFITLKDHKDNLENNLPCRLINPAKCEMGRISKQILDDINGKLNRTRKAPPTQEAFQNMLLKQPISLGKNGFGK